MARYTIDFSTNASRIVEEIQKVNKALIETTKQGKQNRITLELDTTKLRTSIDSTFKQLDNQIAAMERKLSGLQIGGRKFQQQATAIGVSQGLRERGGMQARAIQLGAQAEAFDIGSASRLTKQLEAARIEASQIAPNTEPWLNLQAQIGRLNAQLQASDRLAENVQMRENLGAFAPGSLNALEAKLTILRNRAREIAPSSQEWKEVNKEIVKTEQSIERQTKRPLTRGQRVGAAGGAFLYGGGLGGGIGSAVGGIAGGLAGGVPGAFTGAAVGQAVDNITATAFAVAEQANAIKRLRIGLAGASTDLNDFAKANQIVTDVSDRLLIPLEEGFRQFTRLRASTVALGIDTETTGQIFEGITASVLKTGGSFADVEGSLRAVSQVFSKGKVTAEELRGQLGERLPGAVVKFAKANKISLQDLDKAFESGQVSIDQFVTFARASLKESAGYSDDLATRQEYASARYAKAIERMQLAVGKAIGPMLNSIQSFAAEAINEILKLTGKLNDFAKFLENRFNGGGADTTFLGEGPKNIADRLIGGDIELKDLEDRTRFFESKIRESQETLASIQSGGYKDNRNVFEQLFGGPGAENLRQNLPNQIKFFKKQLDELQQARKLAEGKTSADGTSAGGATDPEAEKRASKLLNTIEQREENIGNARRQLEEELFGVRENALRQIEAVERRYQDERLKAERDLDKTRRDLAAAAQEEALLGREAAFGLTGEDPALIEQQRKIGEAIRNFTEEKISIEQQEQDRKIAQDRELEDFKKTNADGINKANERYAKAIGKIQQEYAKSVAKLIEDGSGNGAKRLAAAGKLISANLAQASAKQSFESIAGIPIKPAPGGVEVGGQQYTNKEEFTAGLVLGARNVQMDTESMRSLIVSGKAYFDSVIEIQKAQKDFNVVLQETARSSSLAFKSIDTSDLDASFKNAQASVDAVNASVRDSKNELNTQQNILNTLAATFKDIGQEGQQSLNTLQAQKDSIITQLGIIKDGFIPALAEENVQAGLLYDAQEKRLRAAADQLLAGTEDAATQEKIKQKLQEQLGIIGKSKDAYFALSQSVRDYGAQLDAAKIKAETQTVGQGLGAGFINEAASAYEDQIAKGVSPEFAASVARATEQLTIAKTASDALQGSINGIGSAFAEAMTSGVASVISGTATAQEVFATFLKAVSESLLQASAQIISTYIAIGIAKAFAGFSGGGNPGGSGGGISDILPGASQYFANGGIAKGGFQAFANGGVVNGPTLGLVGEGRYNEAVVPLPNGRSIPVQFNGRTARDAMSGGASGGSQGLAIDMKFETTKINGVEYVSREQLEQAMAETRKKAARDGATQGSQLALNKIKNSPNTRRQLGM